MEALLALILFVIVSSSIITSFVAIFKIINNDFNGSKALWILISMIGFIGPILYLTKGRKLIIKRDPKQISNKGGSNSLKHYYIELISELDTKVKLTFGVSISLIVFGYLVRKSDLYFFWESLPIGYILLLVCLTITLRKDITIRKKQKIKNIWSHIGFWLTTFILFLKIGMLGVIPNTDAYNTVITYLANNSDMKAEIGQITSHTILPNGSIEITTDSNGTYGSAVISLIIKGEIKFIEQTIYLNKTLNKDWTVVGIEE